MFNKDKFAHRVTELRKSKGITQHELAIALGFSSRSCVNKIEKGQRASIDSIYLLADYFNVSIDYLVGRVK